MLVHLAPAPRKQDFRSVWPHVSSFWTQWDQPCNESMSVLQQKWDALPVLQLGWGNLCIPELLGEMLSLRVSARGEYPCSGITATTKYTRSGGILA